MIETADPITFQLAVFLGATMIAAGIGGWSKPQVWAEMFDEFERSPGLRTAIAFTALTFGALIVLLPGGWSDPLAAIVSAIGVLAMLEGLILLAFHGAWIGALRPLLRFARLWAVFMLAAGALLFLAGVSGMFA